MNYQKKIKKAQNLYLKCKKIEESIIDIDILELFNDVMFSIKYLIPINIELINQIDDKIEDELDELLIDSLRNESSEELMSKIIKIKTLISQRKKFI